MTITDILYQYMHPSSVAFLMISYDMYDPTAEYPGYTNILIHHVPNEPRRVMEEVMKTFEKLPNGGSILLDNDSAVLGDILMEQYGKERHDGMAISRIVGVGYIITILRKSRRFSLHVYTPQEWEDLSRRYVIVGMAKVEGHYIKDWVEYHLHIGFDKVYIYDNNNPDGERYDDILREYTDKGLVEIYDIRGEVAVQNDVYNSFYYSHPFTWCAYIDIDEFIWFDERAPYSNIKDFIRAVDNDRAYGVMLQWHCYKATGEDIPPSRPIWEACTEPLPFNSRKDCRCEYMNDWVKSVYKKGFPLGFNEHFAWNEGCILPDSHPHEVSCYGKPMWKTDTTYIGEEDFKRQPVYVKHFLLRNINDFYYRKYLRGHAGMAGSDNADDGWSFWYWRQNMNYFTDITPTLTPEEQIFMRKRGMKINYTFHPDVFINWSRLESCKYLNAIISNTIATEILPNTNTFITLVGIDSQGFPCKEQPQPEGTPGEYDFNFMGRYLTNSTYFDINMVDESAALRANIQEPVVITIGLPIHYAVDEVSIEEQQQYVNILSAILRWGNLKPLLRQVIENDSTILPAFGLEDNTTVHHYGWEEPLTGFTKGIGISLPGKVLTNNTYICTLSQYRAIKEYQHHFLAHYGNPGNADILNNLVNNITTPYHAYISTILAVINKPYYIWPN